MKSVRKLSCLLRNIYNLPIETPAFKFQKRELCSEGVKHPAIFNQLRRVIADNDELARKKFPITPPKFYNFANDIIDQWTLVDKNEQDKPLSFWFVYKDGREIKWTYEELSKCSKKVANVLKNLGAGTKWTRCLVVLPKMPEWWLINVACIRLGVIMVPTNFQTMTAEDLSFRLKSSKSQCIVTTPKIAKLFDVMKSSLPPVNTKILIDEEENVKDGWENFKQNYESASDEHDSVQTKSTDVFQVFFTSGTTDLPKKVVHVHGTAGLSFIPLGRFILQLDRRNVFWNFSDLGWSKTTWSSVVMPWLTGATAFVHEMPVFNAQLVLNTLSTYPIDTFCAPPTVYRILLNMPSTKFQSLKRCYCAGEALNAEIIVKWKFYTGINILEVLGQTETQTIIANDPSFKLRHGSIGKAVAGVEVDIVDDKGNVLPAGIKGNIGIKVKPRRPIGLFVGYEDDPEKFSKCFVGDYYITGDRAHKDKDGYFWYDGRADDIITSSTYRIGPFEVEQTLLEHPDVLESAVVGAPDAKKTQVVKAFIVLNESGKQKDPKRLKKEIQHYVKTTIAPYKYPKQVEFVESLPKTFSGKIKRSALRIQEFQKANK